jgi:hypothetical protein
MKNELEQVEVGVTFSNSLFDYAHSFYSLDSFRMLYLCLLAFFTATGLYAFT